jgi:hypothetical protein
MCRQTVRTAAFPVACIPVGCWWYDETEIDLGGVLLDAPGVDTVEFAPTTERSEASCKRTSFSISTLISMSIFRLNPIHI